MEIIQTGTESSGHSNSYYLGFRKGEQFMEVLTGIARGKGIKGAHFTGLGAFSEVEFGWYELARKGYRRMRLDEQVELLSITGNIGLFRDQIKIHAHVVVGKIDGTSLGGHLFEATICPTLELWVTVFDRPILRELNADVGLPLICG